MKTQAPGLRIPSFRGRTAVRCGQPEVIPAHACTASIARVTRGPASVGPAQPPAALPV